MAGRDLITWMQISQLVFLIPDWAESVYCGKLPPCCPARIIFIMEIRPTPLMAYGPRRRSAA